jgi:tripartite ATP-independent transporter DctM subunit
MIPMLIFLVALVGIMALGIPICFALIVSGLALMVHMDMLDVQIVASTIMDGADNYPLMAVAFFILAGELMNKGGISKRIITFAIALVGHIRGGLGYVAVLASLMFSGLSGAAVADTAAVSSVLIPIMAKAGYERAQAAALIASAGIIAPLMPLSVAFIIFGVTANVSIPKLFMSGIVPSILICICLCMVWAYQMRDTTIKVLPRQSLGEILREFKNAIWAFFLPIIIVGGLRSGIFTPTEGSAIAVFYALFVGIVIYRELTPAKIYEALVGAGKTASIVLFLMATTMLSSWMLAVADVPSQIVSFLEPLMDNKLLLMLIINILILLVGTAMDAAPTILIFTPILMPVIEKAGIDPVYFGFMFVFNNQIGLLTPPVGTVLNVAAGVGKVAMNDIIRRVMPYMCYEVVLLFLFTVFPQLVTIPLYFFVGR